MKLSHHKIRASELITLLSRWHDALIGPSGYLACDRATNELHGSIFDTEQCDFIAATISGANGESFSVFPTPGIVGLPVAMGEQCTWDLHAGKFAVAVFPEEGSSDLFEGFASFGDALRFVAGVAPDQRSHWPLVIDAEVSYYLARDQMTDVDWPDDRA